MRNVLSVGPSGRIDGPVPDFSHRLVAHERAIVEAALAASKGRVSGPSGAAARLDRMATVVSGTWQFGYGERFDAAALKSLPAGSVYSEPANVNHFARTDTEPVLVEISGFGPTDTRYVDPADTPKAPAGQ